jgi:methionyl-tRNA formyltransferase
MTQVSILCSDPRHPVNGHLERWVHERAARCSARVHRDVAELQGGDFLFLVSCQQIVSQAVCSRFRHALVIHASALPQGRGMSPHVWQILEGRTALTVSLLTAEAGLDTGDIWAQREFAVDPGALHDEIHAALFDAELGLMDWALDHCDSATPRAQQGEASWYRRRKPADSEIDPARPLAESFDLLRVADPDRYPAYFRLHGRRYRIRIERLDGPLNDRT